MRLFKNRGDIYISKSEVTSEKQTKILYSLLTVIVIFTVVFLIFLGNRYESPAEFFAEGEVTVTGEAVTYEDSLPSISGKTNFLIMETDDTESIIHYIFLLQADKDNLAYKCCALPADLMLDNKSAADIFSEGGGAALQKNMAEYFGFEIDYWAQFKTTSFTEFANKLGSFVYPSMKEIRFSGGEEDDKFTIHINEGEQKLSGREITNLIRYYSVEEKNYSLENELILKAITGLFNADNFESSESLFRLFIKSCKTDITVRDFENGKNSLTVFCTRNMDITLYTALAEEENGILSQASVKSIKGYFSK